MPDDLTDQVYFVSACPGAYGPVPILLSTPAIYTFLVVPEVERDPAGSRCPRQTRAGRPIKSDQEEKEEEKERDETLAANHRRGPGGRGRWSCIGSRQYEHI
jgi:hypothetical protein